MSTVVLDGAAGLPLKLIVTVLPGAKPEPLRVTTWPGAAEDGLTCAGELVPSDIGGTATMVVDVVEVLEDVLPVLGGFEVDVAPDFGGFEVDEVDVAPDFGGFEVDVVDAFVSGGVEPLRRGKSSQATPL